MTHPTGRDDTRHLLTLEDAAERLCVHPRSVRRWVAEGQLPAYRIGKRHIRVDRADVDAMLVPIPAVSA